MCLRGKNKAPNELRSVSTILLLKRRESDQHAPNHAIDWLLSTLFVYFPRGVMLTRAYYDTPRDAGLEYLRNAP